MGFDRESAASAAKSDLAERLSISESDVSVDSLKDRDFPDMSLGAPEKDEMSAQMIATGWEIDLSAKGRSFQYRADKHQLRLKGFEGRNYRIRS